MKHLQAMISLTEHLWKSLTNTDYPIMSFKPNFIYHQVLNVIFYSIDCIYTIFFLFYIFNFIIYFRLNGQTSIHLLDRVIVQPLNRMLVQSEPNSHAKYVHFEPSQVVVGLGTSKDFHVVRASNHFLQFIILMR